MKKLPVNKQLFHSIKNLIQEAQNQIVRNVNLTMVLTYFQIGHYIAEGELKGKDRADYAERTMLQLAWTLQASLERVIPNQTSNICGSFTRYIRAATGKLSNQWLDDQRSRLRLSNRRLGNLHRLLP